MSGGRFDTITGVDWARALPAARKWRAGANERRFSGPACPMCGEPGLHLQLSAGLRVIHSDKRECNTFMRRDAADLLAGEDAA